MTEIINGPIWDRNDFGMLCEWRMLYRVIEIGVDRADFAMAFLHRCYNCGIYLGIDTWAPYHEMSWSRDADFLLASMRMERFGSKAKLMRSDSATAANLLSTSESKFFNTPWDFIYIDASHRRDDVLRDIEAYWPMLSTRGILAGHDWSMSTGDHPGVAAAVCEFADRHKLTVHVTWKDDPQSWFLFKDGSVHPFEERSLGFDLWAKGG